MCSFNLLKENQTLEPFAAFHILLKVMDSHEPVSERCSSNVSSEFYALVLESQAKVGWSQSLNRANTGA